MAQVQVPLNGEVLILTVGNISAGGVLLNFDRSDVLAVSLGTVVQVFLDLPVPGTEEMISLKGEADVVRINSGRDVQAQSIALMWSSSDAAFARTLAQILEIAQAS